MSQEAPKVLGTSTQNNKEWPDSFAFYNSQITELLSTDILLPPELSESSNSTLQVNAAPNSLFGSPFGNGLTDCKKSRLQLLLRQIVFSLSQEVDQMLYPVHAIHRIRRHLQYRKSSNVTPKNCVVSKEVDDELSFFIEEDPTKVEAKVSKHSDQLLETLGSMEKKVEGLIDMVLSCCRPMTTTEKQQLQKLIRKLPSGNLKHVVEIIQHKKDLTNEDDGDEIKIDLENQEDTTLWRLYYYVRALENAEKLSSQPPVG